MATYAVGDIQGCYLTFLELLERVTFRPGTDRLWLCGDLVNRGPRSLEVLRWCVEHADDVVSVLGNHDLHLLRRWFVGAPAKTRDTLDAVLCAGDAGRLCEWLCVRPLLFEEQGRVLVHAGLHPGWTIEDARARARNAESMLGGKDRDIVLRSLESRSGVDPVLERCLSDVDVFTRIRMLDAGGLTDYAFNQGLLDAPPGYIPWFRAPDRKTQHLRILFGHWAALGYHKEDNVTALDSGCVWGRSLSAVRLEDDTHFSADNCDAL